MEKQHSDKHPKALPFLFLTEMWERFGFYTVQGLLVLYMTQYFGFSDAASYLILAIFGGLAYMSPLIGGYLASHYIGYEAAILWGGVYLMLGYAMLALPQANIFLYPALATIIVGNGLFKPNVSSILGLQYAKDDPKRDSGFTIFYVGINIGVLLTGFTSGYVKDYFGWQTCFAMASIGLIIGLCTFLYGLVYIKETQQLEKRDAFFKFNLFLGSILAIAFITILFDYDQIANWLLPLIGVICLIFLIVLTLKQNKEYRRKMTLLSILIVFSVVFWMLFIQIFNSANLFVSRLVNQNLFGIPLTTTIFYASESVFIILLGPLFAWLWHTLGKKNKNPSPISKFSLAMFFAGLGFLILVAGTLKLDENGLVNPLWVFFAYFSITIGELLLSPIGLASVTLLAPSALIGLMMGIWFVATGFGGFFAGWLALLSVVPPTVTDNLGMLAIYRQAFLYYAAIAFFVGFILLVIALFLRKVEKNLHGDMKQPERYDMP